MTEIQTFPCIACGAPATPKLGVTHMTCEYCGSALTIPKELQQDAVPLGSTFKIPEPKPTPEIEAAEFLRKAQPVAAKAFNLFALPDNLHMPVYGRCDHPDFKPRRINETDIS